MADGATIFAEATAPGRAAIAIIRVSGAEAHAIISRIAGGPMPADRRMRLRTLSDPTSGEPLDCGLVAQFPAGSSPTGEPYGEFHLHGGVAATGAVLMTLAEQPGARLAVPGEFARRALANGRMDLSQVEAVADLVAAQTEAQRRQALRLLTGGFAEVVDRWRTGLVEAAALLEAAMEFADEGLPHDLTTRAHSKLATLATDIGAQLAGLASAELTREGFEVAITGAPNVGKSSLLNAITGREVSIATPVPGTTRDVVEARCVIDGQLVVFLDTAGLRETADPVERIGVARARSRAAGACLRLVVHAPDCPVEDVSEAANDPDALLVWNKTDVASGPGINVCATSGVGVSTLLAAIAARLRRGALDAGVVVRKRHVAALAAATEHLAAAQRLPADMAAEEVRGAMRRLDTLMAAVDSEEVLGDIFSRFCIGK